MSGAAAVLLAGGRVPQTHRFVSACRGQALAIGRPLHREDTTWRSDTIFMSDAGPYLLAGRRLPETNRLVRTCRCQSLAVRRPGQRPDSTYVRYLPGPDLLAGRRVPETDGLVNHCRCQGLAVRRPGHPLDTTLRSRARADLLAGRHVPEAHRLVPTRRCQGFAVRRPGHRGDTTFMACAGANLLAGRHVPYAAPCLHHLPWRVSCRPATTSPRRLLHPPSQQRTSLPVATSHRAHRVVSTCRGQGFAVRRPGYAKHVCIVPHTHRARAMSERLAAARQPLA